MFFSLQWSQDFGRFQKGKGRISFKASERKEKKSGKAYSHSHQVLTGKLETIRKRAEAPTRHQALASNLPNTRKNKTKTTEEHLAQSPTPCFPLALPFKVKAQQMAATMPQLGSSHSLHDSTHSITHPAGRSSMPPTLLNIQLNATDMPSTPPHVMPQNLHSSHVQLNAAGRRAVYVQ